MVATNDQLRAGTAAVPITPAYPVHLQGYTRGPSTGSLDELEARAIVFDDGHSQAAIVTADLIGLDIPSVERIRACAEAASGIAGDHIMVACSHTHSGPAVQVLGATPPDEEYQRWVEQALGQVIVTAARSLQPVTLGVGEGLVDINVNRRVRTSKATEMLPNPRGTVDKRVRVLRIDPADAPQAPGTLGNRTLPQVDPVAVLFSYVCHATVKGSDNFRFSADYPGAARRVVESIYGATAAERTYQTRAFFLPGCFGNVRPHLLSANGHFRGSSDHELKILGRLLGSQTVQVAEQIGAEQISEIAVARREVRLPYGPMPSEANVEAAMANDRRREWAQAMLDHLERDGHLPEAATAEVQVMRLGRHWLVTTPGETMLEIGQSIERGLADLALAQPECGDLTLALGYTNGNVGYICTASSIFEKGYEPWTSYTGYLRPAPFAPEAEQVLIETALELAQEVGPAPR